MRSAYLLLPTIPWSYTVEAAQQHRVVFNPDFPLDHYYSVERLMNANVRTNMPSPNACRATGPKGDHFRHAYAHK